MAAQATRGPVGVDGGSTGIPSSGPPASRPGPLGVERDRQIVAAGVQQLFFFPEAVRTTLAAALDQEMAGPYAAFKAAVLAQQIANETKAPAPVLSEQELEEVEHGKKLRKDAAPHCRDLLAAARAEMESGPPKGETSVRLGITSAYRTLEKERALWSSYFYGYFIQTLKEREALPGGAYGQPAVKYMARYVAQWKAAPGYSNHSFGVAVDFFYKHGRRTVSASKKAIPAWKETPLFKWLSDDTKGAAKFGFKPYYKEPWHWEYKP
jgi:hypothetical protein